MELTLDEKQFLVSILKQISINASTPDAIKTCTIIKSILEKVDN